LYEWDATCDPALIQLRLPDLLHPEFQKCVERPTLPDCRSIHSCRNGQTHSRNTRVKRL
jgi:hypothetical protein